MELFEAISKRRAVRKFNRDKPVSGDEIKKIIDAGLCAPSAGNGQSWHFVVVRDARLKKRLALEAGHQQFIDDAPVAIVVCADLERAEHHYGERGRKTYSLQETAAAAENMMLAATALGLSTCWVGAFNESLAAEILSLPSNLRTLAIIPVGFSAETSTRIPPKRKIEEVVTFK